MGRSRMIFIFILFIFLIRIIKSVTKMFKPLFFRFFDLVFARVMKFNTSCFFLQKTVYRRYICNGVMTFGTGVHKSITIMFITFCLVTGKNEDVRFVQTHNYPIFFKKDDIKLIYLKKNKFKII
ncbi:unnamed protein product [Meganyctiphanes norvegica]|uniref:Uncharacterized protein n=1 Tax=Meganyctiphanes norvegica TaxID=48144 RepID=A0AAV2S4R2_MEGNR